MRQFFNKLKEIYHSLKTEKHYRFMYLMSIIIALLLDMTGMSIIGNIVFTMFGGVAIELIYCYAPKKTITIFDYEFDMMDIKKFREHCEDDMIQIYHDIDNKSFSYNMYGIASFIIFKLFVILF